MVHALGKGKRNKSVGGDGISLELLRALVEIPEGKQQLLSWFNSLLHEGHLPKRWSQVVMVLLPQVRNPSKPKDTRPISIWSAVERVFNRMVLEWCKRKLRLTQAWQCAGPHRTADYLHAVLKLIELEREWSCGLALIKVDIMQAFDSVRRDVLLRRLRQTRGYGRVQGMVPTRDGILMSSLQSLEPKPISG